MSDPERFAPTVHIVDHFGGYDYTPRGWMWVMGFALGGCDWAIQECSTEAFRDRVRADLLRLHRERAESMIHELEQRLVELKRSIEP